MSEMLSQIPSVLSTTYPFLHPVLFKECVDNAVKLYSAGSTEVALLAEWDKVEPAFKRALSALKAVAETPEPGMLQSFSNPELQ